MIESRSSETLKLHNLVFGILEDYEAVDGTAARKLIDEAGNLASIESDFAYRQALHKFYNDKVKPLIKL